MHVFSTYHVINVKKLKKYHYSTSILPIIIIITVSYAASPIPSLSGNESMTTFLLSFVVVSKYSIEQLVFIVKADYTTTTTSRDNNMCPTKNNTTTHNNNTLSHYYNTIYRRGISGVADGTTQWVAADACIKSNVVT